MSGASAGLFVAAQALVLKWDHLENVLAEATARNNRAEQAANVSWLRALGASHIAMHPHPATGDLFGVIAYPYFGPMRSEDRRVGNFQEVIRKEFVAGGNAPSVIDDFEFLFATLLDKRFQPFYPNNDGVIPASTLVQDLPDLAKFDEFLNIARGLTKTSRAEKAIEALDAWADKVIGVHQPPAFPDSRLVHGDPRFANIMVNPIARTVELIDFGAGAPGRHVFHDLARFEVDVLLRTTPTSPRKKSTRTTEIQLRVAALLAENKGTAPPTSPEVRIASVWRSVRDSRFGQLHNDEPRALYALFIANELLRRLKWHHEGNSLDNVGATVPEIFTAIESVVSDVPR